MQGRWGSASPKVTIHKPVPLPEAGSRDLCQPGLWGWKKLFNMKVTQFPDGGSPHTLEVACALSRHKAQTTKGIMGEIPRAGRTDTDAGGALLQRAEHSFQRLASLTKGQNQGVMTTNRGSSPSLSPSLAPCPLVPNCQTFSQLGSRVPSSV
jgi:hypothetical protein